MGWCMASRWTVQAGGLLHADVTAFVLARGASPLRPCNRITVVAEAETSSPSTSSTGIPGPAPGIPTGNRNPGPGQTSWSGRPKANHYRIRLQTPDRG